MDDDIYTFDESDPAMGSAIEEARRTLGTFFEAFVAPKSNQTSFLLKVLFEVDGEREHIWVADINASVFPLECTIANEPRLAGLEFMKRATFHPAQISDWMYLEDGYLIGGFTTQAIRARLSPAKRTEYDAHAPYKFR